MLKKTIFVQKIKMEKVTPADWTLFKFPAVERYNIYSSIFITSISTGLVLL